MFSVKGVGALVTLGVGLGGASMAHLAQRAVDPIRHAEALDTGRRFVPSPQAMKLISLGFDQQVGDILWIRTILAFGSNLGERSPEWGEYLYRNLLAVAALEPKWRTTYFYGGSLLRAAGAIDQSTALFELGSEALPDDSYFPFSVGMNYFLHHGDPLESAKWLKIAAERPGAPEWYKLAGGAFVAKKGERDVARRYLAEELERSQDDDVRADVRRRLAQLDCDELAERLNALAERFAREQGGPLQELSQLVGPYLKALPPDPLGGQWVLDYDGEVLSSIELERDIEDAKRRARKTVRYLRPRSPR